MDRALRQLQALLAVANAEHSLIISGTGDVIEPDDGVIGIGSGGGYAAAAARALVKHSTLSAREIVEEAMRIAAGCACTPTTGLRWKSSSRLPTNPFFGQAAQKGPDARRFAAARVRRTGGTPQRVARWANAADGLFQRPVRPWSD